VKFPCFRNNSRTKVRLLRVLGPALRRAFCTAALFSPTQPLLASAAMDAANPTTSENAGTSPEGERSPDANMQEGSRGKAANDAARVTPMMEQYIEIKADNPDCLLFYRMGDFYELFFQDAEVASRALSIVLTKRGKHLGRDIPMCGVPIERADEYLH